MAPDIKITTKTVPALTEIEYDACRDLNYGPHGGMYPTVTRYRRRPRRDSRAIMAWRGERLIGWALVVRLSDDRRSLQVYVDPSERGSGIGKALIARARQGRRSQLTCYPSYQASPIYQPLIDAGRLMAGNWWGQDAAMLA